MASILIVSLDYALSQAQAGLLENAGHQVEITPSPFHARNRLSGEACQIVLIDVRSPDGGMGLLIEQAHAAWPGCAVIALVRCGDLRRSKVHEMGLWTPDASLVHPFSPDDLLGTVAAMGSRSSGQKGVAL